MGAGKTGAEGFQNTQGGQGGTDKLNSDGLPINDKSTSEDIELKFSDKLSKQQWEKQYTQRGWTEESIKNTIQNSYTTREAVNRTTGNKSTVYYNEDGSYVIKDDITGKIVQISDRNDTNWKPDNSIINPYMAKN